MKAQWQQLKSQWQEIINDWKIKEKEKASNQWQNHRLLTES